MTIKTTYEIFPDPGIWTDSHFEYRITDQDRPFHFVLRRESNAYSLNHMAKGDWGDEVSDMLVSPVEDIRSYRILRDGAKLTVEIDGLILPFEMDDSLASETFKIDCNNGTFHEIIEDQNIVAASAAPATAPVAQSATPSTAAASDAPAETGTGTAIETNGEDVALHLAGKDLVIPADLDAKLTQHLLDAAKNNPGAHMGFMATRPIGQPADDYTVADIELNTPLFALTAKLLLPNVRLLKLVPNTGAGKFIEGICKANGIEGVEIATLDDLKTLLTKGKGGVLIQGGQAFDTLGPVLDKLSAKRRAQISFWTASKTIVPGNKVFPCANAQIWSPPNWILNHNAAIDMSGRRHGVDVAIAAYNADEYVIECAESILCEGRDDVRVIIVDDGSTDGSGDRAAEHFKDEPRVRVEAKPNGGCASARNYGRLVSDATHIAFVDADDFVTPNMFGDLYDLALYSGCEVTQSAFDFYDESLEKPYYPSYEEDVFRDVPRRTFKGQPVIHLQSADIIKGQPTIWRKVYRRDFLDSKDIYFPENVRAYDDYIFQMFTLTAARDVLMLPDHYYHYRQHPAQDIKQGDERHFYMLFMFRDLVARAVRESWPDFRPYAESITDSINWSANVLKPDLRDSFIEATARFCVGIRRIYGPGVMSDDLIDKVEQTDFRMHFDQILEETKGVSDGVHWAYFCGPTITPEFIRMRRSMKKAG